LTASGFVLAIPVFFDTVFYLLVPLARSMHRRTGKHFLKYTLAIVAGGVVTHSIVPPTPGPLVMAEQLGIDLGVMILIGTLVAIPPAVAGMIFATWIDRKLNIPMRPMAGGMTESEPLADHELPALLPSLLPIVLPVVLVSLNTAASAAAKNAADGTAVKQVASIMAVLGNVNFAMLLSTAVAIWVLKAKRALTKAQIADVVETSLMSGGIIILITAAGGAFGAMLKAAQIGPAIEHLFRGSAGPHAGGIMLLLLGALISSIMKIAQGSSTVAMITASAMIAAMIPSMDTLGYPSVLLATAIGSGAMIGSWMNDSGFWVFVKMTGMTEAEGLKTWTPTVAVVGLAGFATSLALALVLHAAH
jgi:GntP family gluconate:H+ symporter